MIKSGHNNVDYKRSWGKWNEPPTTTPKASFHSKMMMHGGIGRESFIMSSSRKPINYNKYCFQLDQLKAVCDESVQD